MTMPLRDLVAEEPAATAVRSFALTDAPASAHSLMAEHPDATVFHSPAWLRAIEAGTGHAALVVVAERAGECVGVLPLTLARSAVFGRALVGSGFAVDGGALAADDDALVALADAATALSRDQRAAVELRGGPALPLFEPAPSTHVTFARDIAGDRDSLLKAIPRKQRAEVRRSFTQELTITTGTDEWHRGAHHAVYATSVRNLGTPVFPRALFEAVLDEPDLDSDVTVVRDAAGEPLSAVLTLYYRSTAMPYWGGGTHAARKARANDALYFAVMEHAVARGCTRFDFGRSKVDSGPAAYKKNWGFEARPVVGWRHTPDGVRPRDVNPTSVANAWKTKLWSRLPLPIANRVGPLIARGLA